LFDIALSKARLDEVNLSGRFDGSGWRYSDLWETFLPVRGPREEPPADGCIDTRGAVVMTTAKPMKKSVRINRKSGLQKEKHALAETSELKVFGQCVTFARLNTRQSLMLHDLADRLASFRLRQEDGLKRRNRNLIISADSIVGIEV
jgi:hypothetical protein